MVSARKDPDKMKINRRFTQAGSDVFQTVEYEKRTSRISNPDGSIVFEMTDAEIPKSWSQLATDIMVSKYFRKAGVPQFDTDGNPKRDAQGNIINGPERSARQVIRRLAGCWRYWAEKYGYFDTSEDASAFFDELSYMLLHQMCAPNSPQWFNTGLNWAYGITGPAQGHFYCDPRSGELLKSKDAYSHPQPHACFIQSVSDDLVNPGGIMDLWTREARLFKYGSGTGSNFSKLRGDNEPLSGGGKSSGLMSFLKIGDRAAGAIKSGGTTRRAAKMVCLDLDHPDIEQFVNWKVREELKVACLAEGFKHIPKDQQELAHKLGLKLDYDFNGEAYSTVSGQNSNNSVRIPNSFFKAIEDNSDWDLTSRVSGKVCETIKARDLWQQIAFAAWRCADPGVQYNDTINQWHTCPQSGRINASNPCITGETRVLTPGGIWRRIDQMIHLPSRVITNLHTQEIHITDGAFPTGTQDVYELKTAGGYTLKLTADHQVWTRARGWVAAADLTTDDELKLPSKPAAVHEVGEPQDARFFQLLGLFFSDSNNDTAALHLDNCLADSTVGTVDDFAQYISNTWGERVYADDYVNQLMVEGASSETSEAEPAAPTLTTTITHRRLLSRIKAFVRTESGHRRFSDEPFTAGLAAQKHLLRGLFSADAEITKNTLELLNHSLGLLQDVQLILVGLGIQSSIQTDLCDGGAVVSGVLLDGQVDTTPLGRRVPSLAGDAIQCHGLRIDPGSLRSFLKFVGLLPGRKHDQLTNIVTHTVIRLNGVGSWDHFASLTPIGRQQVFDLTEPHTQSFIAGGLTIHNCSEYMFLDDTACNLASLNVLSFFDAETRRFDIDAFRQATRLWTIVLETSVLMASFPSEEIAKLSFKFRTLGLGYANLGAMLMQASIPYDSEKGRAICAAITAILTGESYAASAEMAGELGPFAGYDQNKNDMLRVMRNHRRAAWNMKDYEGLDIHPVSIDAKQFTDTDPLASPRMLSAARECWDRAVELGEKHGYRNAQTTVIAPTGTIGLLMDCDTTGVEPDFALVKFKKLAGGGYFKIANQSLRPALVNLGYNADQIHDILRYVMGTLSLHDAPFVNTDSLKALGLTALDLQKIEDSLPGQFEISFAFSGWTLGNEVMERLNITPTEWQAPGFNLLRKLGFTKKQIEEANARICGMGTVENAPHFRPEHYPVFDCANKCGKHGTRYIAVQGHIRMMAAAQPFISGAISKTINLPNDASVEDIKQSYQLSWELGLKANALYRDGSKLSQPLNVKSDEELDSVEADDEENVSAAIEEITALAASAAPSIVGENIEPAHTKVIEKIVERIVERPLRRRLPDTRNAITHKFDVAGHEGYITAGLYADGQPGEVFITMAKEGSTIGGLMDAIATLVSVSLQYGVPVDSLVRKFEHVRFEPAGMTRNSEIPMAKSLVDYIFRWLAMEFVPGYRDANAPQRPRTTDANEKPSNGNGHGHTHSPRVESETTSAAATATAIGSNLRMALISDPLSQQGSGMQADAPACDVCGSITVRSGTCYKCLNCGNSMGCS
jgi:ribonucleoside-diphosphate reductase alpha chain